MTFGHFLSNSDSFIIRLGYPALSPWFDLVAVLFDSTSSAVQQVPLLHFGVLALLWEWLLGFLSGPHCLVRMIDSTSSAVQQRAHLEAVLSDSISWAVQQAPLVHFGVLV